MSGDAQRKLTVEEYLAFERGSAEKHEFVDGHLYLMAGARHRHVRVQGNLFGTLFQLLGQKAERTCVVVGSDQRVKAEMTRRYFYPDVVAYCGAPRFEDEVEDTLLNPCFIAEVLSPSTRGYDKERKFASYRRIATLVDYVLLESDQALVEHYTRQDNGAWVLTEYGPGGVVQLPSLSVGLPIDALYAGL